MGVDFTDNSAEILRRLEACGPKIMEAIGQKAERYAKKLCPVGTVESVGGWAKKNQRGKRVYRGGTLRNSITHRVDGVVLSVGSNVEYAPYVELGTGPHFKAPPEWLEFGTKRGRGVGHAYVKPRPYIRPAIENHKDEYRRMAENILRKT